MRAKAAKKKGAKPRRKPKRRATLRRVAKKAPKKTAPKKRSAAPRRPRADRAAAPPLETEVRHLRSARRRLEHQLTEAVQEIGMLRQFELRAQILEAELAKRDQEIAQLRAELADRLGGASIVSASTN